MKTIQQFQKENQFCIEENAMASVTGGVIFPSLGTLKSRVFS